MDGETFEPEFPRLLLRDLHLPVPRGAIGPGEQLVPDACQKRFPPRFLNGFERHAVDACGTAIPSRHLERFADGFLFAHVDVQPPETPVPVSLRLEIYPPPQVLQFNGRLCHLVLASLLVRVPSTAGRLRSAGVTPPQRFYTPLRHLLAFDPFPGVAGYSAYLAPALSRRGEEGFSSCLACPCHRAAATTPPKRAGRSNQLSTAPCCLRPMDGGSAFGIHFRGHFAFTCVAAR